MKRKDWIRSALTDNHGEADVAQIGVAVVIVAMLALEAWAIHKGAQFNAQELGTGLAAVIGALGVYKWGDAKSPPPPQ